MDAMMTEELIEHELIQGSPEWLEFRMSHDGASEAAAMLGLSKKTSRTELLRMKSSGITKEFGAWVQENILDYGHEVEALARPIIEKQIGSKLYPVVCSRGRMSASCDGKRMAGDIGWEHKQWNALLANAVALDELPDEFMVQPQQCLLVTGADKWIFTVSDGTEENMVSMDILPDPVWFERIRAGWEQFNKDRENYVHVEVAEMPKAEVTIELPALFVHARGQITEHNMEAFDLALTAKLAEVRAIALVTDQDFSNAKEAAKKFRETAKSIKLSKDAMLAQTETIGEAARKMDAWSKDLNETALQLEKDVAREDLKKKEAMLSAAALAFAVHVEALEAETHPVRLSVQKPDFAITIKGKSKYSSMQDAIDAALANGRIAANAEAKDIRAKLAWHKEASAGYEFMFPESYLTQIIRKPAEDFKLVVTTRINQHKIDEAAKEEAQRVAIQAAATAKAEREAAEKLAEAEAKLRAAQAEEDALVDSIWKQARRVEGDSVQYVNKAIVQFETVAKAWESDPRPRVASAIADARQQLAEKLRAADERAKAEQDAARIAVVKEPERTDALDRAVEKEQAEATAIEERRKQAQLDAQAQPVRLSGAKTAVAQAIAPRRPNRVELLDAVATTFDTTNEAALDWILQEFRGDIQHEERKAA